MFSKQVADLFKSMAFRAVIQHTLVFGGMAVVVFFIAYITISRQLMVSIKEDLDDTAQEFSDLVRTGGMHALTVEIERESASHGRDEFYARVLDYQLHVITEHKPVLWNRPVPLPDLNVDNDQWFDINVNNNGDAASIIAVPVASLGWLQVGMSFRENQGVLSTVATTFGWALLGTIFLGVISGWWQVRRTLHGVAMIRDTASRISQGALNERVSRGLYGKELDDLAGTFNIMLDRISALITELRDVSDHIAHDLRTPLTRIRGLAESSATSRTTSYADETSGAIVEECDRLNSLINTMLEITQANAGLAHLKVEMVDAGALISDACDLFLPVAEEKGIQLECESEPEIPLIPCDVMRFQRAVANVIDNAIKFTDEGGVIRINVDQVGSDLVVAVNDTGIGIDSNEIPRVFDRFYRADESRSTPGNGLGLAYVRSIIQAHGGRVTIKSTHMRGTTVYMHLPVV